MIGQESQYNMGILFTLSGAMGLVGLCRSAEKIGAVLFHRNIELVPVRFSSFNLPAFCRLCPTHGTQLDLVEPVDFPRSEYARCLWLSGTSA